MPDLQPPEKAVEGGCRKPDACEWDWWPDHCQCPNSKGKIQDAPEPKEMVTRNDRRPVVEALAKAIEMRCCSFSDGDGSGGVGWAQRQYLRVASEVLEDALPAIYEAWAARLLSEEAMSRAASYYAEGVDAVLRAALAAAFPEEGE